MLETLSPGGLAGAVLATALIAFVVQLCIKFISAVMRTARLEKSLKDFSGNPRHWLYGNTHELGERKHILNKVKEDMAKFSKCSLFWVGPFLTMLRLYDPDYLQAILRTAEPKNKDTYRFLEPWIGKGLLISNGQKWSRARRLLTPAFHFDILKPYISVFDKSTKVMMNKWSRQMKDCGASTSSFDMFHHVSLMTLDSILKCAFSYSNDVQNEGRDNPYIQAVYEMCELAIKRAMCFPYHNDFIYNLTYSGYRFRKACKVAHDLSTRVIESRRKDLKQQKGPTGQKRYLDFLDILLAAKDEDGKGLTDQEIQNEVDTFLFEGHDTTASGISWCLYNLARHPEYQDQCREEVNHVMGDRDELTWEDMSQLKYLTMCIKESLRLHPPVPGVARRLTKPLPLPDKRTAPKDMWINIGIYAVHHNPEVWDDPETYDPSRFSAENSAGRATHAFIPFSAGPRNCIGQQFAMNEMKTCLTLLLRNFSFTVDEGKEVTCIPELILRSSDGLWLSVTPVRP